MFKRSKRRAFSLVEMVVALTLSAVIGLMVVQALDSTAQRASDNTLNAQAQSAARETVDELTRALSAARLPIECQGVGTSGSVDVLDPLCRNYTVATADNKSSVLHASERCLIFYAYTREEADDWISTEGARSSDAVLRSPDLVVARAANIEEMTTLVVERFSEVSLTGASLDADTLCNPDIFPGLAGEKSSARTTFVQRPLSPQAPAALFNYLDSKGDAISFPVSTTALKNISIVDVNAVFDAARVRSSEANKEGRKTFDLQLSVVLSAAGYDDRRAN